MASQRPRDLRRVLQRLQSQSAAASAFLDSLDAQSSAPRREPPAPRSSLLHRAIQQYLVRYQCRCLWQVRHQWLQLAQPPSVASTTDPPLDSMTAPSRRRRCRPRHSRRSYRPPPFRRSNLDRCLCRVQELVHVLPLEYLRFHYHHTAAEAAPVPPPPSATPSPPVPCPHVPSPGRGWDGRVHVYAWCMYMHMHTGARMYM